GSAEWLHVDYEEGLEPFYRGCGFQSTPAGLLYLRQEGA
ncbi:MAG TPA: GNAT family N-acetyltransferase, partial [Chloroflexota bacterium]|nr:GNAT family N-acetyltransferase [Chloroflexota bacterium]